MHNPPPGGPPWRLALGSHRSDVRRALRQPRPVLPARRQRCCVPAGGACTDGAECCSYTCTGNVCE